MPLSINHSLGPTLSTHTLLLRHLSRISGFANLLFACFKRSTCWLKSVYQILFHLKFYSVYFFSFTSDLLPWNTHRYLYIIYMYLTDRDCLTYTLTMLSCMGIYLGLTSFGQVVLEMIQTVVGHDIQRGCLSNQELLQIKSWR